MAKPQHYYIIKNNWVELQRRMDTKGGLHGELMKFEEKFRIHFLRRVWDNQDTTKRAYMLLEHIERGDVERFNYFCTALRASGQDDLVDDILMPKPPSGSCVDQSDAVPVDAAGNAASATSSTTVSSVCLPGVNKCLSRECEDILKENWNSLWCKIRCDDEFIGHLQNVFNDGQIRRLKDIPTEIDQVQQMLDWLERGSMATFDRFCDVLVRTEQSHIATILRQPKDKPVGVMPAMEVPYSGSFLRVEPDGHDKQFQVETGEAHVPGKLTTGLTSLRISDSRPADSVEFTSSHSERDVVLAQTSGDHHSINGNFAMGKDYIVHEKCDSRSNSEKITTTNMPTLPMLSSATGVDPDGREVPETESSDKNETTDEDRFIQTVCAKVLNGEAYNLEWKRGRAFIINNIKFEGKESLTRKGAQQDDERLQQLFKDFVYDVVIHRNKKAKEIEELLKKESEHKAHKRADSFILFILSHGRQREIVGSDNKCVPLERIKSYFDGEQCPFLLNKPKLFFVQACRGGKISSGVATDTSETSPQQRPGSLPDNQVNSGSNRVDDIESTHEKADMYTVHATVEGYAALRHEEEGSYFVRILCDVLEIHAGRMDFHGLVDRVASNMKATKPDYKGQNFELLCESYRTTDKVIYLLPSEMLQMCCKKLNRPGTYSPPEIYCETNCIAEKSSCLCV